ncbi:MULTISPECIES: RsfA family transcriptional regulator [Bacillaceae]|uniref:RsfA family transcriptional regulator n=1 Tax=Bacillaceae TaxID=186817 RepID=UPI002964EDDA|nr:RsfA family transcriptional regulator [Bacillus infantis]MDW2877059.1 RsfA family transcriptional regulator [Bacillus infantis]
MSTTRQDAWTQDEDLLLAEVVLRHIREGGTQLQAFEEVGKQLSRTPAACGFRWNSYVRKQYKSGIELAKKQRKELKKKPEAVQTGKHEPESAKTGDGTSTEKAATGAEIPEVEVIVGYIEALYRKANQPAAAETGEQIKKLENQVYYLAAENERLLKEISVMERDYEALTEIMERARKMVVLKEEDRQQKTKNSQQVFQK